MTAFGPQSANVATALPAGSTINRHGINVDTWCQDCNDVVNNDGTVLNAAFFNVIIGNLRHLVQQAGCPMVDGDMTLVYDAVQKLAQTSGLQTANNGVLVIGTNVQLDLGTGNLTLFT